VALALIHHLLTHQTFCKSTLSGRVIDKLNLFSEYRLDDLLESVLMKKEISSKKMSGRSAACRHRDVRRSCQNLINIDPKIEVILN